MRNILKFRGSKTETTPELERHTNAILAAKANTMPRAIVTLLSAWDDYAIAYEKHHGSNIGEDGVIGKYWAETGFAIKRLLDGETGGLDCGSIAANITESIEGKGFVTDGYNLLDPEN